MWDSLIPLAYLLLSFSGLTFAQCNNATTTLRNIADVAAIATCTTFTGDIVVATDVAPLAEIVGVEDVIGSIIVANNSGLTTITTDSLRTVSNDVILDTLPLLTNITLPMWSSVNTIILNKIPAPNVINMQTRVQEVTNLYITDTTLETLFGLLLETSQMENLVITGNQFLQDCWFGVGNITQQATIVNNSVQMTLTLPNLTYAYNLEIANASAIEMPVLQSVNQNLDISWNAIQNLTLPMLSYVGGDFGIRDNAQLAGMDLPDLVNVQGDLDIFGSPQLENLSGLSALSFIGKDLMLNGEFNDQRHLHLLRLRPRRKLLSKGAIAGIAIAAILATTAVTGLAVWYLLLRGRRTGVREIHSTTATNTTSGTTTERPPLLSPSREKRSSYGYYDLKSAEHVVDAGKAPEQQDVPMRDLRGCRKYGEREMERGEAFELPTPANTREIGELPASPTGAAVEMPSPSEVVGGRDGEGR
ncbi:hypothetical protein B0A55_06322 [Friedmanniomyces simplex]|uniref:Receptor L-domain domain-containing protein n=1 Tax=Friedmanniomyces simplex TaxID=329884 RepID=A0A4U0X3V2_9PEZI|nr:hypothetical protein B0A55_06322 [Friedmanniomyces simplex]